MKKYAIVVTDTGMLPGVNGMINAIDYYGMTDVEFHYLHLGKVADEYALKMEKVPFFKHVYINDLKKDDRFPMHFKEGENVWYCKMYRYLYAIYMLEDYDAVSIFDADMQIVNNIMQYFKIADSSGMLLIPNNDYSGQEYDCYNILGIKGAASPPLHNMPNFFKPSLWKDVMKMIPEISLELTLGDMSSMSHALIKTGRLKDIFVTANARWVISHYCNIRLVKRIVDGKRYLAFHQIGDRINAFHRRWWYESICRKFIEDVKQKNNQEIAINNIKLFWEFSTFFNKDCKYKLELDEKFGTFPKNLKLVGG